MNDRTTPNRRPSEPQVVALLDRTGRVRRLNERMAAALGITAAEGLGRTFPSLFRPGTARSAAGGLVAAAGSAAGAPVVVPLELPGVDGVPVTLLAEACLVSGAGNRQLLKLVERDAVGEVDRLLAPFRLALSLVGMGLWVYSRRERRLEWLGGAPVLAGLAAAGPVEPGELLARLHHEDAQAIPGVLLAGAHTADPPWVRFRLQDAGGGWSRLATRCRAIRLGLDGPELLVGVVRNETTPVDGRERLLVELHEERERAIRTADISASLIAATTEEELSRIVLDDVAQAFGGKGVLLAFVENNRLRVKRGVSVDPWFADSMDGLPLSTERPLPHAIRTGEPQFIATREELGERWPGSREILGHTAAVSHSVIPFGGAGDSPLGGWVVSYDSEHRPSTGERTLIQTLAYLAGQALERIRLQQARLELARILQGSMLPPLLDPLPGLEIAARYVPASGGLDIGGDWYDAFALTDGTVALVIGDVQGHDVDAAAFMGQVRTSIRAFASLESDPGTVLGRTNDLLVGMAVPTFASCTFLRYNPRTGTVQGARAGHVPLVWAHRDGSHGLQEIAGGPVLGVLPQAYYPTLTFPLQPGTLLALVTDGVVEGPALSLEQGLARLGAAAAQALQDGLGPDAAAERLLTAAGAVGHIDDAALLLVRRGAGEHS